MRRFRILCAVLLIMLSSSAARAVQYVDAPPLAKVISTAAEEVKPAEHVRVPLITWGGDEATIFAKGNRSPQVTQACIRKVECVDYPELGMEAVWRIEVEDLPAFVLVDNRPLA